MTDRPEVRALRSAARKAALARDAMVAAMVAARKSGVSLREIAKVTGVSHETARKLTQ